VEFNYQGGFSLNKWQYTVGAVNYNYPLTVNCWNLITAVVPGD